MFVRFVALLPLALLASASHLEARSQCSTGAINCCNSVQTLDQTDSLLKTLGLANVAASVGGLVGLTCSPITLIGLDSNSCNAQTVCCSNDEFNGLVALGCSPINVSA